MPVDESAELQQLIMMSGHAPDDQVEDVLLRLSEAGSYGRVAPGRESIVISAFGDPQMIHSLGLENVAGVERCCRSASRTSSCPPSRARSAP